MYEELVWELPYVDCGPADFRAMLWGLIKLRIEFMEALRTASSTFRAGWQGCWLSIERQKSDFLGWWGCFCYEGG